MLKFWHSAMKRKRWVLAFAVATAVGLAALYVVCLCFFGAGITEANYEKIEIGMTLAEVEQLLGCAQGDYTFGRSHFRPASHARFWNGIHTHMWFGTKATIYLEIDADGRVCTRQIYSVVLKPWHVRIKELVGF